VEKAGLSIDEMVITPLALAESILSDGEKDFGTTIIDLGGGQTTTSVMYERELKFSHVEQEGGEFVTKDISVVLNTSLTNAEALKINYGYAYPERTSSNEEFPVDVIGKNEPVKIDERYLSEIIEARVEQIFTKSKAVLDSIDALNLPGGVILTGGAASLPGIVELAADVFGTNVKLYVPNHMGLRNPVFANGIAIVEYVAQLDEVYHVTKLAIYDNNKKTVKPNKEVKMEQPKPEVRQVQPQEPITEVEIEETDKEGIGSKFKGFLSNIFD
jgi:cell division protein FtsA